MAWLFMKSIQVDRIFICIQYLLLSSLILSFYPFDAAILSFKPSGIPDEYCVDEFSWHSNTINDDSITSYCDDIDNVLTSYCANITFFALVDSDYTEQGDDTDHECIFYLNSEQTILKSYVISDQIRAQHVVFSSTNQLSQDTNILLSQSFLSITSYNGSIDIRNIDWTSNGNMFSFINLASDNIALDLTIAQCQFSNMNAEYGSIVHVPRNEFISDIISIVFDNCIITNTTAQYGGILYVERNNVFATLSECDIYDIAATATGSGAIMHWICQSNDNEVDLCGDVFIFASNMTRSQHNLFTIDLSMDPAQTQFVFNVNASVFTHINGIIFNLNHNDDALGPSGVRIQHENAFIHIIESRFEDNGLRKGTIQQWNHYGKSYYAMPDQYTQNGTIFTIASWTVPNITIEGSHWTNNAALFGTIFHWYCWRNVRWMKDNHCGSIVLQNSTFNQNEIGQNTYFARYGSLMYAQIRDNMQFNLAIVGSKFIQHIGNLIYLEESTADYSHYTDGNMSNYTTNIESSISVILVEDSQFIGCKDVISDGTSNFGAIFTIKGLSMVCAHLSHSLFEGNECRSGASVFLADYAPILHVSHSNFTNNSAIKNGGIFGIVEEGDVTISDSRFVENGWWRLGDYAAKVSIISTQDHVHLSLDIIRSVFIQNKHAKHGCFHVYEGDVYITQSVFEGNQGRSESVVILHIESDAHLNISDSIFKSNSEVSSHFGPNIATSGMFNVHSTSVVAHNVTFVDNTVLNDGIYVTSRSMVLTANAYIENDVPRIAFILDSIAHVSIQQSTFIGNEMGDEMFDAAHISLRQSHFTDNYGSLFGYDDDDFMLYMDECTFVNNSLSNAFGTVLFVNGSGINITANACVFDGNRAYDGYGGVIYLEGDGNISVTNSTIHGNRAVAAGGFLFAKGSGDSFTIYISDTETTQNHASGLAFGGFLYMEHAILHMKRVNLSDNYAGRAGGAIAANPSSSLHLERCDFDRNRAASGGAVYILESLLTCNDCSSNGNQATYLHGGFLYMDKGSNVHLNTVEFTRDSATGNGSTVFITDAGGYFECDVCDVSNATASYGAMLYSGDINRDNTIHITNSHFYDNSGGLAAGAIYLEDNNQIYIANTTFERNTAAIGGAIVALTRNGLHHRRNTLYVDIENTSFIDNYATQIGGALYIKTAETNLDLIETYYHDVRLKPGNVWRGNTAIQGGAIAMDFRSQIATGIVTAACDPNMIDHQFIEITRNTFTNNSVVNSAENSTDRVAAVGGALYVRCMDLSVVHSQFDSNYASYNNGGGAAYLSNTNTYISGSHFVSSTRTISHDGQLFYINALDDGPCDFILENSRITGYTQAKADNTRNYTADYSLIAVDSVPFMSFENVSYTNNGVALMYDQSFVCANIEFIDCKFTGNYGWTVLDMNHVTFRQDNAITTFDHVVFENNMATFGIIRLETSHTEMYHTQIQNNINTLLISTFVLVQHLTMNDSQIVNNTGRYDGIITIHESGIAQIWDSIFTGNTVGGIGGVLHSKASELNIYRSQFLNNTAGLNGGHIAQFENTLYIADCVFDGGRAVLGNGGAIWMSRNKILSGMIATIHNTTFTHNSAAFHGGAILTDTPSKHKSNVLSLNEVQFTDNEAGHSGSAIYIRNKYDISFITHDVNYTNNTAHVIDHHLESWPFKYELRSSQTSVCPGCNVSITINASNLFDTPWIPHNFTEFLFSTSSVPDDYNGTLSPTTQIADFAIPTIRSFELLQGMASINKTASNDAIRRHISTVYQSETFVYGVGEEIFTYGPAILNDTLVLSITGYAMDGFVAIDTVNITFDVMLCNAHHKAETHDGYFMCTQCAKNTYRFAPTATEDCRPCPRGAVCEGGDRVYVENDRYPLITTESGLDPLECSPGSCCLQSLCLVSETENLCPEQRDPSSAMCAACNEGYSVAPLATECISCEGINPWYFIVPAFVYAVLIWWWGHREPCSGNLAAWEIYTFKILSFYYQVLPSITLLIPDQSATTDISQTIEGIFNFDPQIEGICAYDHLTNLQQLLLNFVTPATCLMWVLLFWLLDRVGCCLAVRRRWSASNSNSTKCLKIGNLFFTFFFFRALVKLFLQVYAQITRTSFSLLSCRSLNGKNYMYYSADIECYQPWHFIAFLGVIISIALPFIALRFLIKARQDIKVDAWWHILTAGYKRRVWFYDVFRMAARLFIILLVSIPVLSAYRLVLIRWLVYSYLIIHIWLHPYSKKKYMQELGFDINHLETCTLGILCILVHLADYEQVGVLSVYKTLKLLPALGLVVLLIYIVGVNKLCPHHLPDKPIASGRARTVDNFISPKTTIRSRDGGIATATGMTPHETQRLQLELQTIRNTQANKSKRSPFLSPLSAHTTRRNAFISPPPSQLNLAPPSMQDLNLGEEIESFQDEDDDYEKELNMLSSITILTMPDEEKSVVQHKLHNRRHGMSDLIKKLSNRSHRNVKYSAVANDTPTPVTNEIEAEGKGDYKEEYDKIGSLIHRLSHRSRTRSNSGRYTHIPDKRESNTDPLNNMDALFAQAITNKYNKASMDDDDDQDEDADSDTMYTVSATEDQLLNS
eukprot:1041344_1